MPYVTNVCGYRHDKTRKNAKQGNCPDEKDEANDFSYVFLAGSVALISDNACQNGCNKCPNGGLE